MKEQGRITDDELSKYNTSHVVYNPKGMTAEELYEGYLWIYRNFYSLQNIWRRMPEHGDSKNHTFCSTCFIVNLGGLLRHWHKLYRGGR